MKNLGPSLVAMSLFIRDRLAQGVSDLLVARFGIGPFGVATGMLRAAAVLQAATVTSKLVSGNLGPGSALEVVMVAIFCWVCIVWARLTAVAARRPPRPGSATASALRRDDYLTLLVMVVAFILWDLADLVGGASLDQALSTTSDVVQGVGFLLGSTLWRDLPRTRRLGQAAAPAAG